MTLYLSAKNVRKSYKKNLVLKDISIELFKGEILALLGPNGSGKTTFIKIIATLLTKDSGDIEIMGYDIDKYENEVRHLFGYVGQDTERSAYPRLTARENLRYFGALHGLDKKLADVQIEKLAHYFDFRENVDKLFMHLSGGQKQTMVIMRALLYDPPIVYLDEPTKGLDPLVAKRIRAFLKHYVREEQKSLLLTSHILSEVDEMANRVALIHEGIIPIVSTSTELKQAIGVQAFIEIQKDSISESVKEQILQADSVLLCREREADRLSFGISNILDGTEAIIHILRKNNVQTQFYNHDISLEDAFVHHIGVLKDNFDK